MTRHIVRFTGLSNLDRQTGSLLPRLGEGDRVELHVRRRNGRNETLALPAAAADAVKTLIDRLLSASAWRFSPRIRS